MVDDVPRRASSPAKLESSKNQITKRRRVVVAAMPDADFRIQCPWLHLPRRSSTMRTKGGPAHARKRKRVMKRASGFVSGPGTLYRQALEFTRKAGVYAYR